MGGECKWYLGLKGIYIYVEALDKERYDYYLYNKVEEYCTVISKELAYSAISSRECV